MSHDIHDYERRMELMERLINRIPTLSDTNRAHIFHLRDECYSQGLSTGRVVRYLCDARKISEWLGKDLSSVTKEDIKALVGRIERSQYARSTKRDLKITLKKLFKLLRNTDDYPDEVSWIKASNGDSKKIRVPEEMLTEEDIKKMISVSRTPMERAFISLIYESGCRIGEVLNLKIKHIKPVNPGLQLLVDGKTGPRRVRVISSEPYVKEWINKHPSCDDPESYLWIYYVTGQRISYNGIRCLIRRLKNRAAIRKHIYPHLFRHSRATYLANYLTEAQMKEFFGWVQGSDMASIYVHLSGRDVDSALLRVYGLSDADTKPKDSILKPLKCFRCDELNQSTNKFCHKCGMPLSEKTAMEVIEKDMKRKEADQTLDEMLEDPEFRESFLGKLESLKKKRSPTP